MTYAVVIVAYLLSGLCLNEADRARLGRPRRPLLKQGSGYFIAVALWPLILAYAVLWPAVKAVLRRG